MGKLHGANPSHFASPAACSGAFALLHFLVLLRLKQQLHGTDPGTDRGSSLNAAEP